MNKLGTISATAVLTGALLFCVFAGVAALDELARLPFYHTLPVTSLVINAAWLLLLLHKRGRIEIVSRTFARLVSTTATFFRPRLGSDTELQPSSRSSSGFRVDYVSERPPSPEAIEVALRKIHSVVSGFSSRNPLVTRAMSEEEIGDEAHQ